MSTRGVASSAPRKARTSSSVFFKVCPALSARWDDIWIAGPSAMGSVNGIPSSMTSAPAAGSARTRARDVSGSGSPAVRNVTSAARPAVFSSAKRRSIRVAMGDDLSRSMRLIGRPFSFSFTHRRKADIDGAEHQYHDRSDELHPFLLLYDRSRCEKPDPQKIRDVGNGYDDQDPTNNLLPADHRLLPCTPRRSSAAPFEIIRHARQVLVAASGQVEHHQMILRLLRREIHHSRQRMRRLERGNDALEARAELERRQGLLVGGRKIFHPLDVVEPGVFRANAGIIEAGGDRV